MILTASCDFNGCEKILSEGEIYFDSYQAYSAEGHPYGGEMHLCKKHYIKNLKDEADKDISFIRRKIDNLLQQIEGYRIKINARLDEINRDIDEIEKSGITLAPKDE